MTRANRCSPLRIAAALVIGCGSGPAAAAAGGATISGTVRFTGTPVAAQKVKMDADPICQQQHAASVMTEDIVVTNGALQNVFVYVKEGVKGSFPAPTTPVKLEQTGCWYAPHVFGIQVGQPLEITNDDATLHNINAKPMANQPFNIAQPVKGMKTTKQFSKPEVMVPFKCNVHPWMHAYAGILEHPFFSVSGADGSFAIKGLPAGTYTLEAWQEKLGTHTQTVTVADGESKTVEFTFAAP